MIFLSSPIVMGLGGLLILAVVLVFALAWYGSGRLLYPPRRPPASSPGDYGLEAQSVSFQPRQDLVLRGWFVSAENPKGTVVVCHGYAGDCSPDLPYARLLRDAGYNTLLFDFRSHGQSDGHSISLVYFERQDLLTALDYLKGRGITRVGLIGFSMGGAIAISTAALSQMVVGVVADCSFAELHLVVQTAALAHGFPGWLAPLLGWLTVAVASLRLRANLFSADPIHWVDKIAPRPLLLMHAGEDRSTPVVNATRLFDAAHEPKELWVVPNAAHRRIEEVAPEEYSRRVLEFFDRVFRWKDTEELLTKARE
jgi:alpha-beta hydrolase superfamily lysophospholipase